MGVISLLGACFLIYLGLSNLRASVKESKDYLGKDNALLRGIATNLVNPNTYMFWLTIGGPMILESAQTHHISATILFILGFYLMLVGSKTAIALVVDKFKTLVKNNYYAYIIRALGVVLIVFALIFVIDALEFVGIL
jgi:threonine/homoserine/homoserine lactone efflux protein